MRKRFLCMTLLALLLQPVICIAGSPDAGSFSRVSENWVFIKMTDSEMAQASGQGAFLGKEGQGSQARRIILWDEWAKAGSPEVRKNLPNQGQLIINGAYR